VFYKRKFIKIFHPEKFSLTNIFSLLIIFSLLFSNFGLMISDNSAIRLIFGLKLKTLRQQLGMNYQQLSEATGMAVSYLHDIENGKKYPKADKILLLAKALKVDYDYLVSLTAKKRLQPIIDFMNSDFIGIVPWEHFGITPSSLLNVFANMPDKITAFISTMLKRSQSVQLSKENFYTSALRSYQDLHDNYFEELEDVVQKFREKNKHREALPINTQTMEQLLLKLYKIKVDRKGMVNNDVLKNIRSFFAQNKNILYINKGLSPAQEKFLIGRELAFQHMKLTPRPYETIVQSLASFEILLHNFYASYFSNALLMPEDKFIEDLQLIFAKSQWNSGDWAHLIEKYDVTAESLMHRLTSIIPGRFGLDQMFFLRIQGDMNKNEYELNKELYLSQLHNPYTNTSQEHYCRRWIAISIMNEVKERLADKKSKKPIVRAQISKYWNTHNSYFCITFAKPMTGNPNKAISVTIGILLDQKLMQKVPYVNNPTVPVKIVNTTCERCDIMNCKERAAKPTVVNYFDNVKVINENLQKLN
jgi:transcriptional regulator with XRE-family HTH domain